MNLYPTNENNHKTSISYRVDSIKRLLNNKDIIPLINLKKNTKCKTHDMRIAIGKKFYEFCNTIKEIGGNNGNGSLEYIKSGSTGHTFHGKTSDGFEYALKVVAYPKKDRYGDIYYTKRPENVEILMLRLLSSFVINNHTPHVILPICTFDTDIKIFTDLAGQGYIGDDNEKYKEFEEKYKRGEYFDTVSILISEWASEGDLSSYIRKNYKHFTPTIWKVIFFQIISTLAVIHSVYPAFRHNDLKANNILVQKISSNIKNATYRVNGLEYKIPQIGIQIKLWDFDFACVPNVIDNLKVQEEWTKRINVTPEQNKYYDIHYFFNTLIHRGFFGEFMVDPIVPEEAKEFVKRILPEKYRTWNKRLVSTYIKNGEKCKRDKNLISKRWRLLIKDEYITPSEILKHDKYFDEFRMEHLNSNFSSCNKINLVELLKL